MKARDLLASLTLDLAMALLVICIAVGACETRTSDGLWLAAPLCGDYSATCTMWQAWPDWPSTRKSVLCACIARDE